MFPLVVFGAAKRVLLLSSRGRVAGLLRANSSLFCTINLKFPLKTDAATSQSAGEVRSAPADAVSFHVLPTGGRPGRWGELGLVESGRKRAE